MTSDREREALAFAVAGDAMIIVDRTGTIQAWNEAADRLLGTTAPEAVGKTLALIVPPEHRARHMAGFHAAIDSGSLAHRGAIARVKASTADGHLLPLGMSLALLYAADGTADGVVAVLRPVEPPDAQFVSD